MELVDIGEKLIDEGDYEVRADLYAGSNLIARASDYQMGLTEDTHTFLLAFPGGLISTGASTAPLA